MRVSGRKTLTLWRLHGAATASLFPFHGKVHKLMDTRISGQRSEISFSLGHPCFLLFPRIIDRNSPALRGAIDLRGIGTKIWF